MYIQQKDATTVMASTELLVIPHICLFAFANCAEHQGSRNELTHVK